MNTDWVAAFTIGLLGAGHCLGMCGGIAAAVTMGIGQQPRSRWLYLALYNIGRVFSYTLIGALFSGIIANIGHLSNAFPWLVALRLVAAVMMILLALHVAQIWQGLLTVEKLGQWIWKPIAPIGNKLLPLRHPLQALPFGIVWGWLPCGLVYSTLSLATLSGSATGGAVTMFAFGLGTLPAMLCVGALADQLQTLLKNSAFRRISALALIGYGIHTGYVALRMM
ncbi:sulfite exporter TauE/SafE family protein [Thaumasiovibrio subtropicus]|uniref:sulfite exporter TauE/SafE family protein n=1 Tax=Thaumasiovibrio subtropicus TaxID=1891207 RepID=UPI000B35E0F2|nr:sulfite exporter TauE/SafE family protein [Thaumasiovibrio subtropicus]